MRLAIGITTAPRPRETFTRSYSSLRAAGFTDPVLVKADGPVAFEDGGAAVRENVPILGGLKNWCDTLETLLNDSPAPWLLILEDDILWAKGAAAALAQDLRKLDVIRGGVGYLSLYLSRKVARGIEQRRGGKLPPGLFTTDIAAECWGSQAYVIPRETARELLADTGFDDRRRNYEKNRNRDNIVSGCLAKMGKRLYYRVPCLVNHELGSANSSLALKPVQRALLTDYWTGKP